MSLGQNPIADPHRPQYHFLPPAHWMNDPNGLIQWEGAYHLFYQYDGDYRADDSFSGIKYWGHAVSKDLVHWEHWPIALSPSQGGPDKDGCWSGSAVNHNGVPTLIYTGVFPQVQCIATSRDGLVTWEKHSGNPVLSAPPDGFMASDFRDPYVWREADGWYAAVGTGVAGVGGAALLYRSEDLRCWHFVGPLLSGEAVHTGTIWECPSFFPLGDKHVLIISPIPFGRSIYFTGDYTNHSFVPTRQADLDLGGCLYAPQVMADDRGRHLLWGWLWETRSAEAQHTARWAGVMSLPRVLSMRPDGLLGMEPAPELEALRGVHRRYCDLALVSESPHPLHEVRGDSLELVARISPRDASGVLQAGLHVLCSPDGDERTGVLYDSVSGRLVIDRRRASLNDDTTRDVRACPLELERGEALELRVFVDHSVLEVFANGRACLSSRVYPTRADSLGVEVVSRNNAQLEALDAWDMVSIW